MGGGGESARHYAATGFLVVCMCVDLRLYAVVAPTGIV